MKLKNQNEKLKDENKQMENSLNMQSQLPETIETQN